jgi:GNAT superfamily N-acetyltransferase
MKLSRLSDLRRQLGQGARWLTAPPSGVWRAGDGFWCALSGVASPDVNLAAVYSADRPALQAVETSVRQAGCPAVLSLAGPGLALAEDLGPDWSPVGTMPVMGISLGGAARVRDERVRRATGDDTGRLVELLRAAYGVADVTAAAMLQPLTTNDPDCAVYTLETDEGPVSALVACQVQDTLSIWCMATAPEHARRGHGRALLGQVLRDAQARGATLGLLGATPAGEPLYTATGWEVLEQWALHVNAPSVQFGEQPQ